MTRIERDMLVRSIFFKPAGIRLIRPSFAGPRLNGARLAIACGALAIGLSGAWVKQRGLGLDFVLNLAAPEPRFSAPAVPYLREQNQDEENADLARPEVAAPPVNLATAAQDLSRDLTGLKEAIS